MPWPEQNLYRLLADLLVLTHFAFIIFVLLGGLLMLKWPRVAWLHIPAALWGVMTELLSLPCPLTPMEKHFQRLAGDIPYEGDFIAHFLLPLIYPPGLTPNVQILLGIIVIVVNIVIYTCVLTHMNQRG